MAEKWKSDESFLRILICFFSLSASILSYKIIILFIKILKENLIMLLCPPTLCSVANFKES